MESPSKERMFELARAWVGRIRPQHPGEFDQVLPMNDFKGNRATKLAKISWNPDTDRYKFEPVTIDTAGNLKEEYVNVPKDELEKFEQAWKELGIIEFHRVNEGGKPPEKPPSKTQKMIAPTVVANPKNQTKWRNRWKIG